MKALVLAAGVAAIATAFPAPAENFTIGGTFAEGCSQFAQSGDFTFEALRTCDRALTEQALAPGDKLGTYVNRGIVRMFRNDFVNASADFDQAIAMDSRRAEPWLNKAILHVREGDSAGAIPLFDKAIALGTDRPDLAYYGRGLAHEDVGDIKQAYADLKQALARNPTWAAPARDLARYRVVNR
jgi:tetratricopeptide (TPR) repeat protein